MRGFGGFRAGGRWGRGDRFRVESDRVGVLVFVGLLFFGGNEAHYSLSDRFWVESVTASVRVEKGAIGVAEVGASEVEAADPGIAAVGAPIVEAADRRIADAAKRDDVEAVRALIAEGADVNAAHGDGMTGLHWAALNGNGSIARLLVDAGAELEVATRLGAHTPLHVAAKAGHGEVVEILAGAGADVSAATGTGAVPLHFAAASGDVLAVTVLIDRDAAVDAKEPRWEQTPLMFAAALGRTEAVSALLAAGADATATARVMDLVERDIADRASQRRRSAEIAALRGGRRSARVSGGTSGCDRQSPESRHVTRRPGPRRRPGGHRNPASHR